MDYYSKFQQLEETSTKMLVLERLKHKPSKYEQRRHENYQTQ
jgi:hypothetical protein